MATYSPTVLAWPVGTDTSSGIFLPGSGGYTTGEGIVTQVGSTGFIPCSGFDECYVMPLGGTNAATPSFAVWALYGNKQSAGTSTYYNVKLLGSMTTAAAGFALSVEGGSYYTKNPTYTAAFTSVLDDTVGCTTKTQAGSSTVMGTVGIAHLGGADFIAITCSAGDIGLNMLVRFG